MATSRSSGKTAAIVSDIAASSLPWATISLYSTQNTTSGISAREMIHARGVTPLQRCGTRAEGWSGAVVSSKGRGGMMY